MTESLPEGVPEDELAAAVFEREDADPEEQAHAERTSPETGTAYGDDGSAEATPQDAEDAEDPEE